MRTGSEGADCEAGNIKETDRDWLPGCDGDDEDRKRGGYVEGWMGAESEQRLSAGYTLMTSNIEAPTTWQRTGPTWTMSSTGIDALY